MAFSAPRSRIPLRQIRTEKPNIPLDQIIQVEGQSPVAEGITKFGDVLGSALARQRQLALQGQQVAALASMAGETPPPAGSGLTPETYEKGLTLKETRRAKQSSQADARANLELKIAQLEQPTVIVDPATGKVTKSEGLKGLSIINDEGGNPTIFRGNDYKPGAKVIKDNPASASPYANVRANQSIMTDLPSRSTPNTAAGAAYQVKVSARQGKALIAQAGSPQQIALAASDLARAVQRSAPHLETLQGSNFANNWATRGSMLVQKITADPSGKDVPKLRRQLYDMFNDLDQSASPFIDNQLKNTEDIWKDHLPSNWDGLKKRERGEDLPDIPFYNEKGVVDPTTTTLKTLPAPLSGAKKSLAEKLGLQ